MARRRSSAPDLKMRRAKAQELCRVIEEAFSDVTLGEGVGLKEGLARDNWEDQAKRASSRSLDEKYDWSSIPPEDLNRCSCSLSSFDAEGMRFHLPAFLIGNLTGECEQRVDFYLTHPEGYSKAKFALLSDKQRHAVRQFLLHISDDPEYQLTRPNILRALVEYWTAPSPQSSSEE
jgi:hypothetical protein